MNNEQRLTFSGVNAHHTNGLAERRIRSLQDLTRATMIHQHQQWKMTETVNLWPFPPRMANDAIYEAPSLQKKDGNYPLQIFSNTDAQPNIKHWIPFGCPVYVLDAAIHSGRGIHNKWEYRSKFGIYLGRFPNHGQNLTLVLNHTTGLVSPKFHVKFYPKFYTIKQDRFDTHWQTKAGFFIDDKTKNSKKK